MSFGGLLLTLHGRKRIKLREHGSKLVMPGMDNIDWKFSALAFYIKQP